MAEQEDTGIAALSHLAGLIGAFVVPIIGGVLGPLIFYATRDKEDFVKENARNALNWQISLLIMGIISGVFIAVGAIFTVAFVGLIPLMIGVLMAIVLSILDFVFVIVGAIKAADGEAWEYPLTYDFV
jgi:uncharacterized Tic20 family protein